MLNHQNILSDRIASWSLELKVTKCRSWRFHPSPPSWNYYRSVWREGACLRPHYQSLIQHQGMWVPGGLGAHRFPHPWTYRKSPLWLGPRPSSPAAGEWKRTSERETLGVGASDMPQRTEEPLGKSVSLTAQGFLPTFLPCPPSPGLSLLFSHPRPCNWKSSADHRRTWFPLLHLSALCTPEAGEWPSPVSSGARMYQTHRVDVVLEGSRGAPACLR